MPLREPRAKRGGAAVAGWLIEDAETADHLGERLGIRVLFHFEGVEAGAIEKQELVAQNMADRAQLAAKR